MNKKIILASIVLLLIIVIPIVYSDDEVQIRLAESRIESSLADLNPTFTNVLTTVYFTPSCTDYESWCSPEKGSCFETTGQIVEHYGDSYNVRSCVEDRNAGWCCIPENHRGLYEEIKCQGSGVCQDCEGNICRNAVYYHSELETTQADSLALDTKFSRGITSTQTDPKPKWTIAVNPVSGTPGHIPYGTLVYIYFSPNHAWNGIYKAEDTGSAFRGEAKIDIYAGVGKEARDQAIAQGVSNKHPQIYVLDEAMNIIDAQSSGIAPTLGEYRTNYAHTINYDSPKQIFERARQTIEQTKNVMPEELEATLKQFNYSICPYTESNLKESELILKIADCINTRNECYCNIKLDEQINITQNKTFYLNNISYDVFFELEYKGETEFELVLEDEFYILINESNMIVTKQELDDEVTQLVDELSDHFNPSNFVDDTLGTDFFSNIPFVDIATGFLNPTGFVSSLIFKQNFDLISFTQELSFSQIQDTILNKDWVMTPNNNESPITICTAPRVHHLICDDLTNLEFAIKTDYLE